MWAFKRSLSCVWSHVILQVSGGRKCLLAYRTTVRFLSGVLSSVKLKLPLSVKCLWTVITNMRLFFRSSSPKIHSSDHIKCNFSHFFYHWDLSYLCCCIFTQYLFSTVPVASSSRSSFLSKISSSTPTNDEHSPITRFNMGVSSDLGIG